MEEAVHLVRQRMPHARHGAETVGARAQMRQFAQPFEIDLLLAQRIAQRRREAQHFDRPGFYLDRLTATFRGLQRAFNHNRRAGVQLQNFVLIIRQRCGRDHLQVRQTRPVVDLNKRKAPFGIAPGSHPSGRDNLNASLFRAQQTSNPHPLHVCTLLQTNAHDSITKVSKQPRRFCPNHK